jgi:hypothetical protein
MKKWFVPANLFSGKPAKMRVTKAGYDEYVKTGLVSGKHFKGYK